MAERVTQRIIASPVGNLLLRADQDHLLALDFTQKPLDLGVVHAILDEAEGQLRDYFAGRRQVFDLPLALTGTPFQERVWQALRTIPYGQVISYSQLAQKIQQPKALRAVGSANGKNPLAIIIPCHRVIAKDGGLGGFSGGLTIKEKLLSLEGITIKRWTQKKSIRSD